MNLDLDKEQLASELEQYLQYHEERLNEVVGKVKAQLTQEKTRHKKS